MYFFYTLLKNGYSCEARSYKIFCTALFSMLEAECIHYLKGKNAYHDGHKGSYIQLYFYEINILYFTGFSVCVSVHIFKLSCQKAYYDGHNDRFIHMYFYEPNILYITEYSVLYV